MSLKTVSTQRPTAPPRPKPESTEEWIEALELAQGILHDAAQAPRQYVERLHVEKGGE